MRAEEKVELERAIDKLGETAIRLGLNSPAVQFEVVPARVMYEMAAYYFPNRFPHWTHGRDYFLQKSRYDHGLSKIYEQVVNTDPPLAYLMETNKLIEQKLVIAHVLGHVDFFGRNIYFRESNRHMDVSARAHAELVTRLEQEQGFEAVEQTLDCALSIAHHVDPAASFFRQKNPEEYDRERLQPSEPPVSEYDDIWHLTGRKRQVTTKERKIPPEPQRDILLFLAEQSRYLEDWQRTILHLVRAEWMYFFPFMRTKVMNEGYASFWHERILENSQLTAAEHFEFRRMHTDAISAGHRFTINPYLVGYKIWRDIERRWEEPTEERTWYDEPVKRSGGEGLKKVFEVASGHRDAGFVRTFLTEELVKELDLYSYKFEGDAEGKEGEWVVQSTDWQKVRDSLANELTSLDKPAILVVDGDYHHKGELLLSHDFEGDRQPLDLDYAGRTLRLIYRLWGRSVHLETKTERQSLILRCEDGKEVAVTTS